MSDWCQVVGEDSAGLMDEQTFADPAAEAASSSVLFEADAASSSNVLFEAGAMDDSFDTGATDDPFADSTTTPVDIYTDDDRHVVLC